MKFALFLLLGLVGGFLLGGIEPRRELAAVKDEASQIRDDLVKARNKAARCGGTPFAAVPGLDRVARPAIGPVPEAGDPGALPEGHPQVRVVDPQTGPHGDAPPSTDPGEQFDLVVDAQRLRADQSRAALREQAGFGDAEMARLDGITASMNEKLAAHADDLMEVALSGEEPEPREMLGLTHEVTGILYESQSAIDELVGDDRAGDVDPEAQAVWNYIDLDIFRGAVESAHEGLEAGP